MKKTIILFLSIIICGQSYGSEKTNKIIIHFEGREYKSLDMIIRIDTGGERSLRETIHGQTINGHEWYFVYPDSVYNKHSYVSFEIPSSIDSLSEMIGFKTVLGTDTLFAGGVCFSKGISEIYVKYLKTDVHLNSVFYNEEKKTYALRTVTQDQFLVQSNSDEGLLASIEALGYKYSMFPKSDSLQYNDQLELYVNMTKKYPESHYFVWLLASI